MNRIPFDQFLADLSAMSEDAFIDPRDFDWPDELADGEWYFTPELISIHGTDTWASMDETARQRLSFFEAVNFFSLNIHGEKFLISEISRRLFGGDDSELSRYLTHFVDEEARHMMYFSGFCRRYAGRIYADRTLHGTDSGDEELDMFLLFARINVFEEVVDHYNRVMARDTRLAPVAREINRIHHIEELRHLSFGRRFLANALEQHVNDWDADRRAFLREHLSGYLNMVWKQYDNPDVYRDAGIEDAFGVWQAQATSEIAAERRRVIEHKRLSYLRRLQLVEEAA